MSKEAKIIKDLKERNDMLKNQYMQEQARNYHLNYVIDKYKSVLDEIREYMENGCLEEKELTLTCIDTNKIKQILDKVR